MPKPGKALTLLEETLDYLCISRCAQCAFLCGVDGHNGKSYEYRIQWIVDRLKQLTDIFAIDICAYSEYTYIAERIDQLASDGDCSGESATYS
ncbi:MAG: hypothetical protein AB2535_16810 [Candidatus Thiodiazotropha endolucinida]